LSEVFLRRRLPWREADETSARYRDQTGTALPDSGFRPRGRIPAAVSGVSRMWLSASTMTGSQFGRAPATGARGYPGITSKPRIRFPARFLQHCRGTVHSDDGPAAPPGPRYGGVSRAGTPDPLRVQECGHAGSALRSSSEAIPSMGTFGGKAR